MDGTIKCAVTPATDPGHCGSCWAFSFTDGTEGQWEIVTDSIPSLSEQKLMDRSKQNSGCSGGPMDLDEDLNDVNLKADLSTAVMEHEEAVLQLWDDCVISGGGSMQAFGAGVGWRRRVSAALHRLHFCLLVVCCYYYYC